MVDANISALLGWEIALPPKEDRRLAMTATINKKRAATLVAARFAYSEKK